MLTDSKAELPRALPIETVEHALADSALTCSACGKYPLEWTGESEHSEELDVVERQLLIKRHVRKRYRCECGAAPTTATGPLRMPNAGPYGLDFAISVAVDKYGLHVPLERQARALGQASAHALALSPSTLWEQLDKLAKTLHSTYAGLHAYVAGSDVVQVRESTWSVPANGKSGVSRAGGAAGKNAKHAKAWWVLSLSRHDAVYHRIEPARGSSTLCELLGDFNGLALIDDYDLYATLQQRLPRATCVLSWTAAQRDLAAASAAYPECGRGLELLRELFDIERDLPAWQATRDDKLRDHALAYVRDIRSERCKPLCDSLQTWAQARAAQEQQAQRDGRNQLHRTLTSLLSHWSPLTKFLEEPRVPCCPHGLEGSDSAQPVHTASKSQRGAEVAAVFYSLIESAKLAGVAPAKYLRAAAAAALRDGSVLLPQHARSQR